MSERYNFSLTTFSPSGKLLQIEHALTAVAAGAPSVGIKAVNGVIIAAEKKFKSSLTDPQSSFRVEQISRFCGVVYSGLTPDFRVLVKKAQKEALEYKLQYGEEIPPTQLAQRISLIMQEFTQSGGVRPFGVSLLVAGWDVDAKRPFLYQCDPSGAYFAWKATALGKNYVNGKTFLEKRYNERIELEDAVHTALLVLKESFEGQMTPETVDVGIADANGFRRLSPAELADHLAAVS